LFSYGLCNSATEEVGVEVALQTFIQQVVGSNLDRDITANLTEVVCGFLQPGQSSG
jgi:hypothetical protein